MGEAGSGQEVGGKGQGENPDLTGQVHIRRECLPGKSELSWKSDLSSPETTGIYGGKGPKDRGAGKTQTFRSWPRKPPSVHLTFFFFLTRNVLWDSKAAQINFWNGEHIRNCIPSPTYYL